MSDRGRRAGAGAHMTNRAMVCHLRFLLQADAAAGAQRSQQHRRQVEKEQCYFIGSLHDKRLRRSHIIINNNTYNLLNQGQRE